MDIGEVIQRSGLPATTLHLWEKRGLITPCSRVGLRRQYPEDILERLAMIVVGKQVGFTLEQIGDMLAPGGLGADRIPLRARYEALLAQRARLDRAIEGLAHALECQHPSPLDCPGFKEKLRGVLPVTTSDSVAS